MKVGRLADLKSCCKDALTTAEQTASSRQAVQGNCRRSASQATTAPSVNHVVPVLNRSGNYIGSRENIKNGSVNVVACATSRRSHPLTFTPTARATARIHRTRAGSEGGCIIPTKMTSSSPPPSSKLATFRKESSELEEWVLPFTNRNQPVDVFVLKRDIGEGAQDKLGPYLEVAIREIRI